MDEKVDATEQQETIRMKLGESLVKYNQRYENHPSSFETKLTSAGF